MQIEFWFTYVATVFFFLLSPGPSHLFMLSTSASHGFGRSWATAVGDLSAHLWQITLASMGLVGFIYTFREVFIFIKWAGVAYLIYIGIKQFMKKSQVVELEDNSEIGLNVLFWRGFAMSSSNPKAVVFFAALFPQFIDPSRPTTIQFAILGLTYIAIDCCFLMFYGYFADWLATRFEKQAGKYLNKISGTLLICSAVLLGMKDIKDVR